MQIHIIKNYKIIFNQNLYLVHSLPKVMIRIYNQNKAIKLYQYNQIQIIQISKIKIQHNFNK
jgi:hypothetical protein